MKIKLHADKETSTLLVHFRHACLLYLIDLPEDSQSTSATSHINMIIIPTRELHKLLYTVCAHLQNALSSKKDDHNEV